MVTTTATESEKLPKSDELLLTDHEALSPQNEPLVLVCSIYQDQRPLRGAAGELDWRLRGFLSRFVIAGRIRGTQNELVYIPLQHHNSIRHLLLVGLGPQDGGTQPGDFSGELLKNLSGAIMRLNFKRFAISQSSFPFLSESKLKKALNGVSVEFTQ